MSKFNEIFARYGLCAGKLNTENVVIFIGTLIEKDCEAIEILQKNAKKIVFLSPLECDKLTNNIVKIKCEVGSEAGVLALLAKAMIENETLAKNEKEYLEQLDDGYLSAESNVGEEEIEEVLKLLKSDNATFLLGDDLESHPSIDAIIGIIALISRHKKISVSLLDQREIKSQKTDILPPSIKSLDSFDGTIVYFYPSATNEFQGSVQFAIAAKIKDKENVIVTDKNGKNYERIFEINDKLKGTISILGSNEHKGFRYEVAQITKRQ